MKKRRYIGLVIFIAIVLIIAKIIDNHVFFYDIISKLISLLSPLFWGIGIAYVLNPLMVKVEKKLPNFKRIFTLLIVYTIFIGVLSLFFTFVGPRIVQNILDLIEKFPKYWNKTYIYISDLIEEFSKVSGMDLSFLQINESTLSKVLDFFNTTFNQVFFTALNITRGMLTIVLGIFVSIYLLLEKENYLKIMKKNVQAFFGEKKSHIIYDYSSKINKIFKNFIIGKFIDSAIIAIICFVGLSILRINYAFLLSLIVGITNMIPYFGPFIGAIPAVIITLFFSPVQAFWVAIFILCLQQFDGWYLGPLILGETVGISPLFIILAILIGGGFFGPLGMLLAVPVFKSISIIWNDYIENKIKHANDKKKEHSLSSINLNINFEENKNEK